MASVIPASPSPQLQTVLKCLEGFNKWDLDLVTAEFSEDWKHYLLPRSLQSPGRNKEEWRIFFSPIHASLKDFTVTISEIIESPGKVFLHASSTAVSTTGVPYANEYALIFHLVPDASGSLKISVMKEFVDSKYTDEFFAGERERQVALAGN